MIYRDSAHSRFTEHLESVRSRREGRGLMPYRAPLPPSSGFPVVEEQEQNLLESFPPLEMHRGPFALGALLLLAVFFGLSSYAQTFLPRDLSLLLIGGSLFLGWIFYESRRGRGLARGEVAWLKGLPFEVRGYLAALCESPFLHAEYTVRAVVTLKHEALPAWVIEAIPELSPRPMRVLAEPGALRLSIADVKVKTKGATADEPPRNVLLRDWLHECVTQILLPIDTTYPIARVEFFVA